MLNINDIVSVFGGTGFVGSHYIQLNPNSRVVPKEQLTPVTNNILWFISTVDNYNVFTDPVMDIKTNMELLCNALKITKDLYGPDFIMNFISSWFVYGNTGTDVVDEGHLCNPTGFYSITKRAAEQLLISYCETFGCKYRILRLGSVMGPGDKKASLKKNAAQFLVEELCKDKTIEIYETPSYRDIIDVKDCAQAIDLVIKSGKYNEIYNIGNGRSVNIKQFIYDGWNYCKSGIIKEKPVPDFHKTVQGQQFYMNNEKLQDLGYKQQYSTMDTLRSICDAAMNKNG